MPRVCRREVVDPAEVQVFHAVQRCVRRAYLCGRDKFTGASFEHRRQWIRDRIEVLASIFGIDCLTFTVMENHLHLILRTRPDVVSEWSDREVAERWLRLFPLRKKQDGSAETPSDLEVDSLLSQPDALAERRARLSDVSWWMRCTAEVIARRANREDNCTGKFWEGRFKLQSLLDESSLLACAAYVDLNPVRAAIADAPECCEFTGAKERIVDLIEQEDVTTTSRDQRPEIKGKTRSGWMSPLEINEKNDPVGPRVDDSGRRASCKGFLAMSLEQYLELLDWTGRQIRSGNHGCIPADLLSILRRIGVDSQGWCKLVTKFERVFKRAAGAPESLAREAIRRGQRWMCAPENPLGNTAF